MTETGRAVSCRRDDQTSAACGCAEGGTNAAKQGSGVGRQDAVTRAEADRKRIDGLMIQAQDMRGRDRAPEKATAASGQGGEYVKNDNGDVPGSRGVCRGVSAEHWLDMGI